jgi:hypothetical protein
MELGPVGPNGGRRAYIFTDKDREVVRSMTAYGIPQPIIAKCIGISERTLRRHFDHTIEIAAAEANTIIAGSLFYMATRGPYPQRLPAAIFWLKVRAHWREINYVEQLRPPTAMTDEELDQAIALAENAQAKGGRVVSLSAHRARKA